MLKQSLIKFFILSALLLLCFDVKATHNRAGEIYYEYIGPLSYRATVVTYTKISGISSAADRDSMILDWGDGTLEAVVRVNGPDANGNGIPDGELIGNDIKMNIYVSGVHTYQGPRPFYVISVTDPNRVENIINIAAGSGSVNVPIYFEDTIKYFPPEIFTGNSSPILLNPPIDYANILDTFYHNPNAFDPDGDSLHFSLVPCMQAMGEPVPAFQFPDQFPPGPNNNFTINHRTGEIIWAVPQIPGIYNIAILVREYRNGVNIGTMLRDMAIFVGNTINDPPVLTPLRDTCVVAGSSVSVSMSATDADANQTVTITANGAPFQIDPSRVIFNSTPGNPAFANFTWQTTCNDIRSQFYQVVFKATDNFVNIDNSSLPLADLESFLITVIPPPPNLISAEIIGEDVHLEWEDPYVCASADKFLYFSVWKRFGCENEDRLPCATGLEGTPYQMIATNLTSYTYIDENIDRGNVYSYRIVAHFGVRPPSPAAPIFDRVESLASNEICVELPLDLPVITNVSVEETSTSDGVIFVQWSKPRAGPGLIDTLIDLPPYIYEVFRSEGFTLDNPQLVATFTAPSFALANDTSFFDSLLNTVDNPYSYRIVFKSANGNVTVGQTSVASSVYLTIVPADSELQLSWEEIVPWFNYEYAIFRSDEFAGVYDSIDATPFSFYIDTTVINDSLYCYYVRSEGQYFSEGLINPIINFSQKVCEVPIDTTPPCPPSLRVLNDCEQFLGEVWTAENYQNRLSWTVTEDCKDDVAVYRVYYAPSTSESYTLLLQTTDTSYIHQLNTTIAGCYTVVALDDKNNISTNNDTICIENCPFYVLPNAFTPNGDGFNDLFTPFPGWRFVEKIDMKIYNRWGNLVKETQNPAINWDGTDQVSGKPLEDGVYLYSGFYFVRKLDGTLDKRPLPPNESGGGFIHLIRSK
jgi:gliding motility-associated-like protein